MNEEYVRCLNCAQLADGDYCQHCGQSTSVHRFTPASLGEEFIHGFFHLHHGVFYTLRKMIQNPGATVSEYLLGHRVHHFNPFTLILIFGGLAAFVMHHVHWNSLLVDLHLLDIKQLSTERWENILNYFTLRLLFSVLLSTTWSLIFFGQKKFKWVEHLIGNAFLVGMINLIFLVTITPTLLLKGAPELTNLKWALVILSVAYLVWAYRVWFGKEYSPLRAVLCGISMISSDLFFIYSVSHI